MRRAVGKATVRKHAPDHPFDGWVSEYSAADAHAIVIVDAGDCGWTRGDPAEAKEAIEAFTRGWEAGPEDARERLKSAFAAVRREFEHRPIDDVVGSPWASLNAAMITDDRVVVRWIGPGEAMLVRDGAVIDRTLGHTVCGEFIRKGQLSEDERPALDDIVVRAISAETRDARDESVEWPINAGDVVVLVDGRTAHVLTRAAVARTLRSTRVDPAAAARELVAACEHRANFFRGSAVVVSLLEERTP